MTTQFLNLEGIKQFVFLLCTICCCHWLQAQTDSHYWTNQYGAKGLLLNGAIIASADDETSIFYNPGCLGRGESLGFSFSFLSPTYSLLRYKNLLSDDTSFDDEHIGLSPGFVGVRFKPFRTDKIVAGITSFSRHSSDLQFAERHVEQVDGAPILIFNGELDFKRKLSEQWFGVGLAYNISDHIGIGITQFSVWHSESLRFSLKKEITFATLPETILTGWRNKFDYGFSAYGGFITKAGASFDIGHLKLGITYTSGAYSFINRSAEYALDDLKLYSADSIVTISNRRKDLELNKYRTPQSFGFGFEFTKDQSTFYFSTEYFSSVEEYELFSDTDDPFDGLTLDDEVTSVSLNASNSSVLNFAFGLQKKATENRTWLAGFRTDFNQNNGILINESTEYLTTTPDIYHVSAGLMLTTGKNQISIGIDYGFGFRDGGKQLTDLSNINPDNIFEISGKNNVSSQSNIFMLFLTYDFLFSSMKSIEE